ncbi:MAG: hypothetical protein GY757_34380 [bacterium]|nr:hypothetical protein [bacterium]
MTAFLELFIKASSIKKNEQGLFHTMVLERPVPALNRLGKILYHQWHVMSKVLDLLLPMA